MRRLLLLTALLCTPAATADAATRWVVSGGGWGHGLGMSQYGAYGQALDGRNYRQIVKHYYRGTELGQASGAVRVLLLASVGSSSFSGADQVGNHETSPRATYVVTRSGGSIVVRRSGRRKVVARTSGVLRVTGPNRRVTVGGKGTYRDVIEYRRGASGGVTAVNKVELENYIRGVVPNESPASWPQAALKAQAIAARTYALGTGATNGVYDHVDTVASQVYRGYSSEQPTTNRAVAGTKGQVLRHDGKIIVAFFHSTSGGHTENNENIWGGTPLPYIRGVRDPWDRTSPYHRWRVNYTASSLGNALGVGKLRSADVTRRGVSGRIVRVTLRGASGRVRLHGYGDIKARLALRDAPSKITRISSRGSGARAAAAGVGSRGSARDINGRIAPGRKGARITVERRSGNSWRRVARGRLGAEGRYRIPVESRGTYRVVVAGDTGPEVHVR